MRPISSKKLKQLKEIFWIIEKDARLEWRQRFAINGIILYVFSTVFIVYLAFVFVEADTWISLFWIIMLFASVNAVAKSFIMESRGRFIYYYQLSKAQTYLVAKFIYNTLLLLVVAALNYLLFSLLVGSAIQNHMLFAVTLFAGSMGFAFTFTTVSAIASKARNSTSLMAILSFPLILPQLILLIGLTRRATRGMDISSSGNELLALLGVNVIILVVSYLLFPYLWRE